MTTGRIDPRGLDTREKRALLARLLAERAAAETATAPGLAPIVPLPAGEPAPLSFAQERLWFLHQLAPASPLYNIPMALRLTGPLDVDRLAAAVRAVVGRHEVLRTRIISVDGEASQVVDAAPAVPVPVVDLRALAGPERDAALAAELTRTATEPFDLAAGPPLRLLVARLADDEHAVALTMHHIASDAWSMALFARETSAEYQRLTVAPDARPPAPSPPALSYADYARWQRSALTPALVAQELAFWRDRLAGAPPLELPADRPRPAMAAGAGGRIRFVLPPERARDLRAFCRQAGTTPFTALLTAFAVVLGRYSGQDDIVVGTPVSNRERAEVEGLIGMFVNTLVIRVRLAGEAGFAALVAQVHAELLAASRHQTLPFERLVTELAADRRLDRGPLFNVLVVAPQGPSGSVEFGGQPASVLDVHSGTAKFDLSLAVVTRGEEVAGYLEYRSDLFDAATAAGITRHLDRALAAMLADPVLLWRRVGLLTPDERRRAIVDWNAPGVERRPPNAMRPDAMLPDAMLPDAFAAHAARAPEAIAATDQDEQVTYRELAARVEAMTARLRAAGVGADDSDADADADADGDDGDGAVVAVGLSRRVDLLVAALATWRAGGVYLPIEPGHPAARVAFMLADAGARLVVTDEAGAAAFAGSGRPTLLVGAGPTEVVPADDEPAGTTPRGTTPRRPTRPDGLAYIIYTSGSTGRPKGVAVEHHCLARYLRWWNETVMAGRVDVMPAVSEPSFDGSLKQLFAPLARGGEVWLIPPEVVRDPAALLARLDGWARRRGPAHRLGFTSIPSLWNAMLDALDAGAPAPRLAALALGGDHFPPRLTERTWAHLPGLEIWNCYGPTETTATAAAGPVTPGEAPTIGAPAHGCELYLLDDELEPVPVGLAGRLFIGGPNLARGYLDRAAETRAVFRPHPFRAGARIYDSGDVGRYQPDGRIRLLGRRDGQVKLRGMRLELGEIQAVIAGHPDVREVLARPVGDGDTRRIVAYLVPVAGAADVAGRVRAFLLERLPRWMVPADFVELDAFPRLPSGKTDAAALPVPGPGRRAAVPAIAPRTDLERRIAAVWREVLGVADVGVSDNLFDLGGHSLLMPRLAARLAAELGRDIALVDLFQYPDIASLAGQLARSGGVTDPIDRGADGGAAAGNGGGEPGAARVEILAQGRDRLADLRRRSQRR